MRRIVIVTAFVLAAVGAAAAPTAALAPATPSATPPATPAMPTAAGGVAYPAPATCVDTARALGPAVCRRISAVLAADERASTDEIAVAVVPSTGGASIETWSTGLFNAWGVGRAGKDNGVLLVVAVRDRALRLVTGDGMRGRLPDWQASEIVGGTITPLLAEGRTADAVLAGLDAVRRAIGHQVDTGNALLAPGTRIPSADVDAFADTSRDQGSGALPLVVFTVLAIGGVAGALALMRYAGNNPSAVVDAAWDDDDSYVAVDGRRLWSSSRRSYRSSSRSSSRRSGFGGGRSSGGGASGRW